MGIQGTVTQSVSASQQTLTLPSTGLNIIGIACQKHTIGGFTSIPINAAQNAIFPFSAQRGVTTTDVPVNQSLLAGMWLVNFKAGLKLNHTETGLTSGVMFFYFGTAFSLAQANNLSLQNYAAVEVDVTTSTSVTLTFPGGPVYLTGLTYEAGYNTAETNVATDFSWSTASGVSVDINIANKDPLMQLPLDNMKVAQSLTVTVAFDGTHVATGRFVLYYHL